MVALTLLFLPWSTIRPGLTERGGAAGSGGVGAAPVGPGPVLHARTGAADHRRGGDRPAARPDAGRHRGPARWTAHEAPAAQGPDQAHREVPRDPRRQAVQEVVGGEAVLLRDTVGTMAITTATAAMITTATAATGTTAAGAMATTAATTRAVTISAATTATGAGATTPPSIASSPVTRAVTRASATTGTASPGRTWHSGSPVSPFAPPREPSAPSARPSEPVARHASGPGHTHDLEGTDEDQSARRHRLLHPRGPRRLRGRETSLTSTGTSSSGSGGAAAGAAAPSPVQHGRSPRPRPCSRTRPSPWAPRPSPASAPGSSRTPASRSG